MWENTKTLIIASFLIIFLGLYLFWFGLKSEADPISQIPADDYVDESPAATNSAVVGLIGERVLVIEVVDGDTIKVWGDKTVRLLGIDTPETVDPRRPVGCFGKQASNETKSLLSGKEVIMQKDVSDTDKYKRLLRYIYLPLDNSQLLFVNDYLVRQGFAKVLTYPPDVKFNDQLRQAETEAKEFKRGLWGKC